MKPITLTAIILFSKIFINIDFSSLWFCRQKKSYYIYKIKKTGDEKYSSPILLNELMIIYFVTRSSHLSINSIVHIEIKHAATKSVQVTQRGKFS